MMNDSFAHEAYVGLMVDYPHLAYSMKAVRKAGIKLENEIAYDNLSSDEYESIIEKFSIANSWRDSHIYPMRSIRFSIRHHMKSKAILGDLASRPKRMSSIRRKLRATTTKLDQMNDLGGCRAILDDINGVRNLIESIHSGFPHDVRQEYSYIENPKNDGYRSYHFIFNYCPRVSHQEPFSGLRVEFQVRTRLQHCWATALEAVSLYFGQDLKHHIGDPDWLRLFDLMSAEFSYAEGCPVRDGMPSHSKRVDEIKEINGKINASGVLQNIKDVTHFAENYVYESGRFFIIRYKTDHSVVVESYDSPIIVADKLGHLEQLIELGEEDENVVLVEVDTVEKLIQTYPNYFGDVSLFVSNLRKICEGEDAIEYSMAPQKIYTQKNLEKPNPSLLRRRYTRWTDDIKL